MDAPKSKRGRSPRKSWESNENKATFPKAQESNAKGSVGRPAHTGSEKDKIPIVSDSAVKRGGGRTPKTQSTDNVSSSEKFPDDRSPETETIPKSRGRKRKSSSSLKEDSQNDKQQTASVDLDKKQKVYSGEKSNDLKGSSVQKVAENVADKAPRRGRGRPKKQLSTQNSLSKQANEIESVMQSMDKGTVNKKSANKTDDSKQDKGGTFTKYDKQEATSDMPDRPSASTEGTPQTKVFVIRAPEGAKNHQQKGTGRMEQSKVKLLKTESKCEWISLQIIQMY